MSIPVSVISKCTIKPSSPTPSHLTTFPISIIDQVAPPFFIPFIYFYEKNNKVVDSSEICCRLKTSLAETLTRYYPVAGRIVGNTSVDCNDQGVDFVEARVNAKLADVIAHPNVEDLLKLLLPTDEPHFNELSGIVSKVLLAVQVNFFDCGGTVLSVCLSHKIADGLSVASFVNVWAAKALNPNQIIHPVSEISSLFPPSAYVTAYAGAAAIREGKGNRVITKRFVFDSSKIASLKAKVTNDSSSLTNPTRQEVVSALLWKCFMKMTGKKECTAVQLVNIRNRMAPLPLDSPGLDDALGNICVATFAESQLASENELSVLAGKLRDAISRIDGEFVRNIQQGGHGYMLYLMEGNKGFSTGEKGLVSLSGLCRFPFYKADFGWGKPVWVTITNLPVKDVIILMDARFGDGIEASVTLLEEDMAEFEKDEELLSFVGLNAIVT